MKPIEILMRLVIISVILLPFLMMFLIFLFFYNIQYFYDLVADVLYSWGLGSFSPFIAIGLVTGLCLAPASIIFSKK
jgi:hypothetical protein